MAQWSGMAEEEICSLRNFVRSCSDIAIGSNCHRHFSQFTTASLKKEQLRFIAKGGAALSINSLREGIKGDFFTISAKNVSSTAMGEDAAYKAIILIMTSLPHFTHDSHHLLGIDFSVDFNSVAKIPEGMSEMSLVHSGPYTLFLAIKRLVIDDQCNAVGKLGHVILVHIADLYTLLRVHYTKAESYRMQRRTINSIRVEIVHSDFFTISIDGNSLLVIFIKFCSKTTLTHYPIFVTQNCWLLI